MTPVNNKILYILPSKDFRGFESSHVVQGLYYIGNLAYICENHSATVLDIQLIIFLKLTMQSISQHVMATK